jgi:predicted  nucleic acid-binding Zn-ribbon protein
MEDFEEQAATGGGRLGGCLVQVVSHGAALVLGAVLGIVGMQVTEYYADPEILARPEGELSRAELITKLDASDRAYAQLLAENAKKQDAAQTEVSEATRKVTDLQTQVSAKQDEITVLELKSKKSAGKSAALKKELEARLAELETLKTDLSTALADKARLEEDLVVSREETRVAQDETLVARDETRVAQGETVDARWNGFVSDAIVSICEKGNRNKLARCKEEVRASLSSQRASKFKQCVGSQQAQPRLIRMDDKVKDPQMPRWSEWLDQDSSFSKDKWYITFCDPTLPEAELGTERRSAPTPDFDEDEALDDL